MYDPLWWFYLIILGNFLCISISLWCTHALTINMFNYAFKYIFLSCCLLCHLRYMIYYALHCIAYILITSNVLTHTCLLILYHDMGMNNHYSSHLCGCFGVYLGDLMVSHHAFRGNSITSCSCVGHFDALRLCLFISGWE